MMMMMMIMMMMMVVMVMVMMVMMFADSGLKAQDAAIGVAVVLMA